ncbi:MAG TPA: ion transporter [Pyrinomonadaceae bacterium]|mgnify:CR=1 FL=1|nr:ion transporter [Pyrinomonadaceae bacterium]
MYEKIKYHVYDILVETDDNETIDRIVAIFLMILILLNTIAVVLETVESINQQYAWHFHALEVFSVVVFTLEYVLRLWIAPLEKRFSGRFGRVRYAFTIFALIDLVAILPFYLPLLFPMDLLVIRFLRVFRLFRLFKLNRYARSLNTLDDIIRNKKEELFVTLAMLVMLLLFASSLMYLVENEAQPDKFPDIPTAMWWGIVTLTTVGYGDAFPITPLGKILGGIVAILGIALFAIPTGIFAAGFNEELEKIRLKDKLKCPTCPHCDGDISDVILGFKPKPENQTVQQTDEEAEK